MQMLLIQSQKREITMAAFTLMKALVLFYRRRNGHHSQVTPKENFNSSFVLDRIRPAASAIIIGTDFYVKC